MAPTARAGVTRPRDPARVTGAAPTGPAPKATPLLGLLFGTGADKHSAPPRLSRHEDDALHADSEAESEKGDGRKGTRCCQPGTGPRLGYHTANYGLRPWNSTFKFPKPTDATIAWLEVRTPPDTLTNSMIMILPASPTPTT